MPFRTALNSLNAAILGLRTTANNIANVGTPGFKASRVETTNTGSAVVVEDGNSASGLNQSGAREA